MQDELTDNAWSSPTRFSDVKVFLRGMLSSMTAISIQNVPWVQKGVY